MWSRILSPIGLDLCFLFVVIGESMRIMIMWLNIKILSILFMHVLLCWSMRRNLSLSIPNLLGLNIGSMRGIHYSIVLWWRVLFGSHLRRFIVRRMILSYWWVRRKLSLRILDLAVLTTRSSGEIYCLIVMCWRVLFLSLPRRWVVKMKNLVLWLLRLLNWNSLTNLILTDLILIRKRHLSWRGRLLCFWLKMPCDWEENSRCLTNIRIFPILFAPGIFSITVLVVSWYPIPEPHSQSPRIASIIMESPVLISSRKYALSWRAAQKHISLMISSSIRLHISFLTMHLDSFFDSRGSVVDIIFSPTVG